MIMPQTNFCHLSVIINKRITKPSCNILKLKERKDDNYFCVHQTLDTFLFKFEHKNLMCFVRD